MTKSGWGAIIQGDSNDLDDWAKALKVPFDPWIEHNDGETILRSSSLDSLGSAVEVRANALEYIDRLNGILALAGKTKAVRFGVSDMTLGHMRRHFLPSRCAWRSRFIRVTLSRISSLRAL